MTLELNRSIPKHGLVWITVPKKTDFRGAETLSGRKLVSQFLPAAIENSNTEGFLLVRVPEHEKSIRLTKNAEVPNDPAAPFAAVCPCGLKVDTPFGSVMIADSIDSSEIYQSGRFCLFDGDTDVSAVTGSLFDACRIHTVPLNGDGMKMGTVSAYYDIIRFKEIPLLQVFACYGGEACRTVNNIEFLQLVVPREDYSGWSAGNPPCGGTFLPNPETGTVPILEGTIQVVQYEGARGYETDFEHFFSLSGERQNIALIGGQVTARCYPHVRFGDKYLQIGYHALTGQRDLMSIGSDAPLLGTLLPGTEAGKASDWQNRIPPVIRPEEEHPEFLELDAGDLSVRLCSAGNGIRLFDITDRKTGRRWLKSGDGVLFNAVIRDLRARRNIWVTSANGWEKAELQKLPDGAILRFINATAAPGFSFTLSAKTVPAQHRIEWQGEFENLSDTLSVLECGYPGCFLDVPDHTDFFTPYLSGHVHHAYADTFFGWNEHYANLWCTLPVLSCWDTEAGRGIYYAVHDPEGAGKRVYLDKHMGATGSMVMTYYAENALIPRNSQKMRGRNVWQLYDGDWYDTAMLYRSWALREANWMPPMDEKNVRVNSPAWVHDIGLWVVGNVSDREDWYQPYIDLQKETGVPVTVHLYNWHRIPFDTCYPHYFPVKKYTLSGIRRLQAAGIHVIPYINGRLWDVNDGEDCIHYTGEVPDITFEKDGQEIATTGEDGKIFREAYVSRRLNGERVRLNGVCLSQKRWHDIVVRLAERMYDELGVDGVYVDQTAGTSYAVCYNSKHGHPLGSGGVWHTNGVRQMMQRLFDLRGEKGLQSIYITEDHSEQFIDRMDGMLVWHWSSGGLVPMFPAIYSDRVELFGRNFPLKDPLSEEDRKYARITFAEQMTFGDQLGWNCSFLLNGGRTESDTAMYRQAIRLRYEHRDYYTHGTLCRPPRVTCNTPDIVVHRTSDYHTNCLYGHAVSAGLRLHPTDGSRLLTVINITAHEQSCEILTDLPDCALTLEGALSGTARVCDGKLTLTLPPFSTVMGVTRTADQEAALQSDTNEKKV